MREQDIIKNFAELKKIKPRAEWVFSTKDKIFREPSFAHDFVGDTATKPVFSSFQFFFSHKPAFASAVAIVALLGLFGFTQNSTPGDFLFSIKKMAENSQAVFISSEGQSRYNLELAGKRIDELARMAKADNKKELAPAINEFQASVSKAVESLKIGSKDLQTVKEMAIEIKKIEEKTETIKSLGINIGAANELEGALGELVSSQIKELDGKSLSDADKEILTVARTYCDKGDYSAALEEVLKISR